MSGLIDPAIPTDQLLFVTEVGSRMWGMEDLASDYDLFQCYRQPAAEYLKSGTFKKSRPARTYTIEGDDKPVDAQYMEIGHLVNLLKKGNVNALWAVCSPVVHLDSPVLQQLKKITLDNLSRQSYHSIKGLAMSELSDVTKRKDVRDPQKSLKTCVRTLWFGQDLLLGRKLAFTPVSNIVSEKNCHEEFALLDNAYESSTLCDAPDPKPFEDFLFMLRITEILDRHVKTLVKL
jgi:predicted nucleotidyltransferase